MTMSAFSPPSPISRSSKKILVIELSNLGDAILTYPALSALWRRFPEAEFHLLAGPRTEELFEKESHFRKIWLWEKESLLWKQAGLIARLALQRYSWVIDFRHSLIPLFLPGARRTPILRRRFGNGLHRADQHLALLEPLGIPPANGTSPLPFGEVEKAQARAWLEPGKPVVVMVPGSRSHLKRWPADRFAAVADRLIQEEKAQVLLVGDPSEREIAETVRRSMISLAKNLAGQTTISQLAALLAESRLVITNDSACLHAAEAMGVPTVAIFGPTDEKKYGPRNPRSAVARLSLICAPCERALCPYGHECMNWLSADQVYAAAVKVLRG